MKIENFEFINNIPYYENKMLNISKNSQGYCRVYIKNKAFRLHRLIALKYLKNENNYPVVDHIDNDKLNNTVENLQWLSYSDNSKKAYLQNKNMKFKSIKNNRFIVSEKNNLQKEHKSLRECAKFVKRDVSAVYRVLNGEWNLCNGYKLKYKYEISRCD